jgi:hypothetical protein
LDIASAQDKAKNRCQSQARRTRDRTGLDARFPPGEDDPTFDQLKVNSTLLGDPHHDFAER